MPLSRLHLLALTIALLPACNGCRPEEEDTDPDPEPEEQLWTLVGENPTSAFMSVSGRSANDVYAVGAADSQGGLIVHYDGSTWTRLANSDTHDLWWVQAVDGATFAAGSGATVLIDDGSGFRRLETPWGLGAHTIYGLWASSADDLWVVGGFAGRDGFIWHYSGGEWTEVPMPDDVPRSADGAAPALFKVWGRSADDIWIVGTAGTALHYDGTTWKVVPTGTSELLFTVHGNADGVVVVGPSTVLVGDATGLTDDTPEGAGILQGACREDDGTIIVTGASASVWSRESGGEWSQHVNASGVSPESLHAVWVDDQGGRWAVGGSVLSAALDKGTILYEGDGDVAAYVPPDDTVTTEVVCDADDIDPVPTGSIARRWNEQILNSIRRDIPRPGVHARNLHHLSLALWDAWAVYDDTADPVLTDERISVDASMIDAEREVAMSFAAYRVLTHRYANQVGGATSVACYDAFMAELGLDPTDTHTDGDDAVAVGNRIGQAIIDHYADDGANEAANYADTTGWTPVNDALVVDQPGANVVDPNDWQRLNLATAETQNGIILDSGLQGYICPTWGLVEPWALGERIGEYTYYDAGEFPTVDAAEANEWVMDVLRKHGKHDPDQDATIDISPGAYGNNPLGTNDGTGHPINPVTGEPYAANVVKLADFSRALSEFWADGPKSETPPGHWNVLANDVGDSLEEAGMPLLIGGAGDSVDRLAWDVHLYLALNGAVHDAAIVAWGTKRESLGPRPITLVRWMAENGQSTDASLPSYHPDGLPLEDGVTELITEESAAPGERHHHLRWYIGEVAVYSWRGEPGDRSNQASGTAWMRAKDWFPYQRRTFVTPAFPGFVSGHSTFSRSAAEVLTAFTGSAYFPGGLATFTANAGNYLVFEDGPSETFELQWGTYQDAADQAGQSRIWGGIHIWPDDSMGRQLGYEVGLNAYAHAVAYFDGTARLD